MTTKTGVASRAKQWIFGGGLVMIVSAAVSYGVQKQSISERLNRNEAEHVVISNKLDKLDNGRIINADNISSIKADLSEIKTDIKWIKNSIGCENSSNGDGLAKKPN